MQIFKKYKPNNFSEFWGSSNVVVAIKRLLANGSIPPYLILSGMCGVGKTSMAQIIADEISKFTKIDWRESYNAYDYAHQKQMMRRVVDLCHLMGGRIFIFNEAESMGKLIQGALLGAMDLVEDKYFIFTTTDASKLIPAIHSRCHKFEICRLGKEVSRDYVRHIAAAEGLELTQDEVDKIAARGNGTPREILKHIERRIVCQI